MILATAFSLLVIGCPKNMCFLQVCTNGECKCHVSTCMEGADFNVSANQCVCVAGRIPLEGQCLTAAAADAYCGKGSRYEKDGCKRIECAEKQELDEESGQCVALDQIASKAGVEVGEKEKLGCPAGEKLVVESGTAACVPLEQTCARDESWNGSQCTKTQACPAGAKWDEGQSKCVQYASTGDDAPVVDVAQWASSSFGPNGGRGKSGFCNQFARMPWRFNVPQGQTAIIEVALQLSFPGSEVGKSTVQATPKYVGVGIPVPGKGVSSVQSAADSILATLQQGGGKASAESATTTVRCPVVNAAPPQAVPSGGL